MADEQNTEYDEGSLSSDLAAAFDAAEAEAPEPEVTTHADTPEPLAPNNDSEPDSAGAGGAGQPTPDDNGVPGSENNQAAGAADEATPPVSLPPAAREAWKDTPQAVREAVALREKQYNDGIVKYSADAKRAQQMDGVLGQYQQYFALQGAPVGQTVSNLLQTASLLQMGTPMQRAQTVAQLINQFGVDIGTLDSLLAGEAPRVQQTDIIEQKIQQAVAPFQSYVQQLEQQRQYEQQRTQGQIATELQQFAQKNEFYNDVAPDMADFLDIAAKNGRSMSLEEAYERACALNPQISQILQARKKAPTPSQQRAASTLRGQGLGGPGSSSEPADLHAAISAAWDMAGRV